MIPDETVEKVREGADIVEIIGEYVKLRRAGADYRGPCPFHGGKNPNFSVSPRRGAYHCFKCGVSGDAIEFVRQHLGMDFVDAVKLVGEKSGIVVEEVRSRREPENDPREPLWEANAAAMEFFQETLWGSPEAADARAYLASRGISREVADRFRLGFAPRGKALQERLIALGHDDARLVTAGLLAQREGEEGEPYPRFRDRLMIPILDARERCVGFGGRIMGDSDRVAKYLNSPETPVFSKGQQLYNLNAARGAIRKAEQALVVEGYFDVIRVASAGIEHVVAGLGTALTADQAALLTRLTSNVFLLYDSDDAGLKATFRAGRELLRHGISARVASLPEGEDPDTFVRTHGAAGLAAQLDAALDVFERQVQILERRGWFVDLHKKRRAVDRLLPTIRAAADPLTRDLYINRLSEAAGVSRDLIVTEAAGDPTPRGRARRPPRGGPDEGMPSGETTAPPGGAERPDWPRSAPEKLWKPRRGGDRRRPEEGWHVAPGVPRRVLENGIAGERALVQVMLAQPASVEQVAERYGPESFRDPRYRAIFSTLLGATETDPTALAEQLPAEAVLVLQQLLDENARAARTGDFDLNRLMDGALQQLRVRELTERVDELQETCRFAEGEQKDALLREIHELQQEIRVLGGGRGPWGVLKRSRNG